MKLETLNKIFKGVRELQEYELDVLTSYKVATIENKISPHVKAGIDALYQFAQKNIEAENINDLIQEEERKLYQEEVDVNLPTIKLSQLPKELKGKVVTLLFDIIENDIEEAAE